jgi:hypothetical protein
VEWRFAEDGRAEQVMNQSNDWRSIPPRSVQRNLVQVFDENVITVSREPLAKIFSRVELKRKSRSDTMNVDAIEKRPVCAAAPSACQEIDAMPLRDNATKNLMEVNFGTPAVGILSVVPVDDENPH